MLNAFVTLFSGADIWFYLLLIFAIGLFVAEVFMPNFTLAGVVGVLMAVGAVTERCLTGTNDSKVIIFYIIYIVAIIALIVATVKVSYRLHIKKVESKKYAIVDGNKIPLTPEGNLDYSFLIGKEGEVVTDLKPSGKVNIEDKIYEVTSTKEYIYTGSYVRVEKVLGQKIIVKNKLHIEEKK